MRARTLEELQAFLDGRLDPAGEKEILEAGCGSRRHLRFRGSNRLTGIDLSPEQLELNEELDRRIEGDVQSHRFEPGSFDVIVSWDVLEHLPRPEEALQNFADALRPGGLIVLGLPNARSLWGLVSRLSPHWFHVMVYRRLFGIGEAGRPGVGPFPTWLPLSLAPGALRDFWEKKGYDVVFERVYDPPVVEFLREERRIFYLFYAAAAVFLKAATLGRLGGLGNSACAMVVEKEGAAGSAARDRGADV